MKHIGTNIIEKRKIFLYISAALLWVIGGIKVVGIAIMTFKEISFLDKWATFWIILWAIISFFFFHKTIFPRVVKKNINAIEEDSKKTLLPYYRCLRAIDWLIMVVMMSIGIGIRYFELLPKTFIAGFYFPLGMSLVLSTLPYYYEVKRIRKSIN